MVTVECGTQHIECSTFPSVQTCEEVPEVRVSSELQSGLTHFVLHVDVNPPLQ